jgi:hypothetical protein
MKEVMAACIIGLSLIGSACSNRGWKSMIIPTHGETLYESRASDKLAGKAGKKFLKFLSTVSFDGRDYGVDSFSTENSYDEYLKCYNNFLHQYFVSSHHDKSSVSVRKLIFRVYYEKTANITETVTSGSVDKQGSWQKTLSKTTTEQKFDFPGTDCTEMISFADHLFNFYLAHYDIFRPYETVHFEKNGVYSIELDYSGDGVEKICGNKEFKSEFPDTILWGIGAECDNKGRHFRAVSMIFTHGNMQTKISFDSFPDLVQSERGVIDYEYKHGLREEPVSDNYTIQEQFREKYGKLPYRDWWN